MQFYRRMCPNGPIGADAVLQMRFTCGVALMAFYQNPIFNCPLPYGAFAPTGLRSGRMAADS